MQKVRYVAALFCVCLASDAFAQTYLCEIAKSSYEKFWFPKQARIFVDTRKAAASVHDKLTHHVHGKPQAVALAQARNGGWELSWTVEGVEIKMFHSVENHVHRWKQKMNGTFTARLYPETMTYELKGRMTGLGSDRGSGTCRKAR